MVFADLRPEAAHNPKVAPSVGDKSCPRYHDRFRIFAGARTGAPAFLLRTYAAVTVPSFVASSTSRPFLLRTYAAVTVPSFVASSTSRSAPDLTS